MLAAVGAITATLGFLLGAACLSPKLRRVRAELVAARRLAELDALTGLPNRCRLQRHHQLLTAAGSTLGAILLDLDDFKRINDTWGHQAGDAHLAAVADRLAEVCAGTEAVAGRLAGDEFLVLLPNATPVSAAKLADTALTALSRPTTLPVGSRDTTTVMPTASAGIALPDPGGIWSDLLHRADIALYHAKLQRGTAVLHHPGMRQPTQDTRFERRSRDHPHGAQCSEPATALVTAG